LTTVRETGRTGFDEGNRMERDQMHLAARISYFSLQAASVALVGLLVGFMTVILPPMAITGVVALAGVILLWAMPELRLVPETALRKMFFVMVIVLLCVPDYYALTISYLPWISIRRLFEFAVIILFCITVAGSSSARAKIAATVRINPWLTACVVGFLVMNCLSIFTSGEWLFFSVNVFFDVLLTWYAPLFASILVVRSEEDVIILMKIIAVTGIVVSLAGVIEFTTYHNFTSRYYRVVF
jgi:hypothetical protein